MHCKLSPAQLYDLPDMLTEELFAKENMVRKLLTTVGDQEGGFCIISPDVALNNHGVKVYTYLNKISKAVKYFQNVL